MGTRDALSLEYDNRARVPSHPQIIGRWIEHSARIRSSLPCRLGIRYGAGPREVLDLFPAPRGDGTALVFIHGGYWRAMSKDDFSFIAPAWTDAGVSVIVLDYDLCPAVSMEDIVREMLRASAWVFRNADELDIDRNRLYACGHSAGGQLAAMMVAALWRRLDRMLPADLYKGAVSISGLHDLRPLVHVDFLKADLRLDEERALKLSPAYLPPAAPVPVLACAGALESAAYHWQTALLCRRWPNASQPRIDLTAADHFTIVDQLADPSSELFGAVRRLLKTKTPG